MESLLYDFGFIFREGAEAQILACRDTIFMIHGYDSYIWVKMAIDMETNPNLTKQQRFGCWGTHSLNKTLNALCCNEHRDIVTTYWTWEQLDTPTVFITSVTAMLNLGKWYGADRVWDNIHPWLDDQHWPTLPTPMEARIYQKHRDYLLNLHGDAYFNQWHFIERNLHLIQGPDRSILKAKANLHRHTALINALADVPWPPIETLGSNPFTPMLAWAVDVGPRPPLSHVACPDMNFVPFDKAITMPTSMHRLLNKSYADQRTLQIAIRWTPVDELNFCYRAERLQLFIKMHPEADRNKIAAKCSFHERSQSAVCFRVLIEADVHCLESADLNRRHDMFECFWWPFAYNRAFRGIVWYAASVLYSDGYLQPVVDAVPNPVLRYMNIVKQLPIEMQALVANIPQRDKAHVLTGDATGALRWLLRFYRNPRLRLY